MKCTDNAGPVYRAEWRFADLLDTPADLITVFGTTMPRPIEARFSPEYPEHLQLYIDTLLRTPAFIDRYPHMKGRRIDVVVSKRLKAKAYAEGSTINMPWAKWAWRESVLLHELAHVVTPEGGHGARFCSNLTWLVSTYMGQQAGWLLSALLYDNDNHMEVSA